MWALLALLVQAFITVDAIYENITVRLPGRRTSLCRSLGMI